MKAILEFNLPEEQDEFDAASHVEDYKWILKDFANEFRDKLKYDPPQNKKEYDAINGMMVRLFELAKQYSVDIW